MIQKDRKTRVSRCISYNKEYVPDYNKREKYRFVENIRDGLRWLGPVHEIQKDCWKPKHSGWFLDEDFQSETCYGVVVQLPSRDGLQYVPGYQCSYEVYKSQDDSAVLDFHSVTDDLNMAVSNADAMARWLAENEREYQRRDRLETRIADSKERIGELRKEVKEIIRSLCTLRFYDGYVSDMIGPVKLCTPMVEKTFAEAIRLRRNESHRLWREIRKAEGEL